MQKTIRAATLALGTFALAGFCSSASADWTLTNSSGGDGTLLDGSYPSFTIIGANDGTGPDGNDNTTFYVNTFAATTTISFTWTFTSVDTGGTIYDQGGYILGSPADGTETLLSTFYDTDTPSSGSVDLTVLAGQTFGFYVHSDDSEGGAGMLSINEAPPLSPPPPPPAIAEPQNAALMLAGLAALFAAARRRRH